MSSYRKGKQKPTKRGLKELIHEVDKSDLKSDFDSWPELAEEAWSHSEVNDLDGEYDSVIFTGMGGSGIIGALVSDIANETKSPLPFANLNDYHLPTSLSTRCLVVGVSCSGNTEETLSALSEAHSRGLKISSFGSGGSLKEFSEKWKSGFTQTRMLKVPRSSLPGLLFPVLKLLSQNGLLQINDADIEESIENLKRVRDLAISEDNKENLSVEIAAQVITYDCPALIYSQRRTRAVGLRFRQSLNENAKIHAFNGDVPEVCHNDIVAWDRDQASTRKTKSTTVPNAVMLRLKDDPEEIAVRFGVLRDIVRDRGGKCIDAPYLGRSFLSRAFSMLYFLDYATYFAAILRKVDPIITPSIDHLKSQLNKRLDFVSRLK